jgi:group II intron reverse transcriptase/maturase
MAMSENLYQRLCDPVFLHNSWLRVARKKGTSGADGQEIRDFSSAVEKNILKIARTLQRQEYEPSPLRSIQIPKKRKGTFRKLGIPTVQDRVVFQGVNVLLQKAWTPRFSPFSFAYRPGSGVYDAIQAVSELVKSGKHWFIKGDIQGCFDSLNWDILSLALKEWLSDEPLRALINKALRVPLVTEGRILPRHKGVPQGSPLSPILANLYFYPFDYEMTYHRFPPVRYGDDWLVLTGCKLEAVEGFHCASSVLSRLLIEINTGKSGIGNLEEEKILFLGHKINATTIDAGPNGWRKFAKAVGDFKSARSSEDLSRARAELSHLKSFYRNAGAIG